MKRFVSLSVAAVLCLSFLSGGCVVTESENVETSGMWAHFVVEHFPDDTVIAWAVLRVSGQAGNIIDLVGADRMECNGTRMVEYVEPITNMHWTRAEVAEDIDGLYDFKFIREDETVITTVEIPEVPIIDNPVPGETVTVDDELDVWWDDTYPGDHVNIFLSGGCIQNQAELNVQDDGDYLMLPLEDQDPLSPYDCDIYLEIRRLLVGEVDPAFQGGYTETKRMDGFDLYYAP